jgi:uncharacterized membrane protein
MERRNIRRGTNLRRPPVILPKCSEMPAKLPSRLTYIDWMRGLACVLMFQTHCYDAWLGGNARKGPFLVWSQLLGTLPAPLFLFLAGVAVALVAERSLKKGIAVPQIAQTPIKRGFEILLLGFLFRLQEFVLAWGWSPWTDLLRVDILNTIGITLMMLGAFCWLALARNRSILIAGSAVIAAAISLLTPPLWTTWRPDWLPWPIESYINGVHNLGQPQASLFPIFPWAGFAFAGLAVGFLLTTGWASQHGTEVFTGVAAVGLGFYAVSRWLTAQHWQVYTVYDYWHTSPEFFLLRVSLLLMILSAAYAWCRWGAPQWIFSPLAQLGKTSLLVYWVHIEFVYGRFSLLPKHAQNIRTASLGLLTICLGMMLLSLLRTKWKSQDLQFVRWFRKQPV